MLYRAEGWRIIKAERKKLVATEISAIKRSCKISRIERIKKITKIKITVLDNIKK